MKIINKEAHKLLVAWIIAIAFFMEMMDETIINTAIPRMALSLNIDPVALKSAIISYLISLSVFLPISSWLAERFGTNRILTAALTVFTIASIVCGVSRTLDQLIFGRVLQGIGGALMSPVGRVIILRVFGKAEILRATKLVVIPAMIGSLSGPLVGGIIVTYWSWRWIFFVNVPFGILCIFMIAKYIPNFINRAIDRLDIVGFLLLAFGLACATYAMEGFGQHTLSIGVSVGIVGIGVLSLVSGYYYSRKKTNPIVYYPIFFLKIFRISYITNFLTRMGVASVYFLLPLLYQVIFGWLPITSGLLMIPFIVGFMFSKLLSTNVMRLFDVKKLLVVDSILVGLAIMAFAFVTKGTSIYTIIALSFINGFVLSVFFTAANLTGYSQLDEHNRSTGVTLYGILQHVSTSFGVGVSALLLQSFLDTKYLTSHSNTSAFQWSFVIMGVIALISAFIFLKLPHNISESIIIEPNNNS